MTRADAARYCNACIQPVRAMSSCINGTTRNWPRLPAAVPTPSTQPRFSTGTARVKAGSTIPNDVPATPAPTNSPVVDTIPTAVVACAMPHMPSA